MYDDYDETDFARDYEFEIREIVEKELNRRIKLEIYEIDKIKEKDKKNNEIVYNITKKLNEKEQEVYKLHNRINTLEMQHEMELEKAKTQTVDDYFADVKDLTKVYYLKPYRTFESCPKCGGTKKIKAKLENGDMADVICQCCANSTNLAWDKLYIETEYVKALAIRYINNVAVKCFVNGDSYAYIKPFSEYYTNREEASEDCLKKNEIRLKAVKERVEKFK